jgi:hypothetical protein
MPGSGRRPGRIARSWLRAYVSAYVVAAKLLTKLGVTDLAMVAADRSAAVSLDAASLSARGLAAYQVACALLRAGRVEDAEHLSVATAEQLQAAARFDQPVRLSVAGALWLLAAVVAARRADRYEARQRLDHARLLADILGEDGNYGWTAFGPTNVAIHRVSVAAELGDAGDAPLALGLRPGKIKVHLRPPALQASRELLRIDGCRSVQATTLASQPAANSAPTTSWALSAGGAPQTTSGQRAPGQARTPARTARPCRAEARTRLCRLRSSRTSSRTITL